MNKIIIFIDGSFPTEADLALGEKLGTKRFRNARETAGCTPEPCLYATAVDTSIIPEGYRTEAPSEGVAEAAVANPTAPAPKLATGVKLVVPKE